MSRSYKKKPIVWITRPCDEKSHRAARHIVKMELKKDEPDLAIIESDTRGLGYDEWGTWVGWPSKNLVEDKHKKAAEKIMRKK